MRSSEEEGRRSSRIREKPPGSLLEKLPCSQTSLGLLEIVHSPPAEALPILTAPPRVTAGVSPPGPSQPLVFSGGETEAQA